MARRALPVLSCSIAFLSFAATPCSAAARAVSGIVSDPSGGLIAGAAVTLESREGQRIAATTTDPAGAFSFADVPRDGLILLTEAPQFSPRRLEIEAGDGDVTDLRIVLEIAGVTESVVVTVTRSERSLADQPASVSLVTGLQIEETPANTLDDVLRTVPSVNVPLAASYQNHPTANSISMRGLGGIRALVLVDGVPINDPFFGYVQWSRAPMEDVSRVEVVRGGGSPLWGNYAMGGVINVITSVPEEQEFRVEGYYGNYGTYRGDGRADLVLSDALKVRAEFNSWGTDGFKQVPDDAGPIYVPTSFDALNAALTAYLTPRADWHAGIGFHVHDNDQTLLTPLSTNDQRIYDFSGNLVRTFGRSDLTVTGFYEHSRFVTDNTGTPEGVETGYGEFVQNRHTTPVDSSGGSVQWSMPTESIVRRITLGSDFQLIDGEDSAAIFDETGTQVRTDVGRGKQRFLGAFGQVDVFPSDRFEILASARIQDVRNYDGFDGTGGLGEVPDNSANSFDPRLSIRYNASSRVAVRGAAYRSFRAPNLDNLYRAFSVPFGIFEPNAQLSPEKLKGAEAGFDLYGPSLVFQLTAYVSNIDDLITYRNLNDDELPPGFFFGTRNINAGKARSQGVDATADWTITSRWSAHLGYAYMDSHIVESELDPLSVGQQQAGVPRQQVDSAASYRAPVGFRASARLRWVDESWGDNDHTLPLPSHFVADASFACELAKEIEVFVDIQNLFDETYIVDNSGFNPPLYGTPRSAIAGLRARFR
jgi:outer membrane receptor protein involved in Fe transport